MRGSASSGIAPNGSFKTSWRFSSLSRVRVPLRFPVASVPRPARRGRRHPALDRGPIIDAPTVCQDRISESSSHDSPSRSAGLLINMLLRREASEERDEHIDMTPMVDVVFQLMTFMLFSMKLVSGDVVKMPEARHGVGVEENAATFILLAPATSPSGKARILLGLKGDQGATIDDAVAAVSKGVSEGR